MRPLTTACEKESEWGVVEYLGGFVPQMHSRDARNRQNDRAQRNYPIIFE